MILHRFRHPGFAKPLRGALQHDGDGIAPALDVAFRDLVQHVERAEIAALACRPLRHANAGKVRREVDAETTPLEHPELYQYDFDLPAIAEVWRRGSVIASWLLDLMATSLAKSPDLAEFQGRVSDSGEGRWTLKAAIDESVPAPILANAIDQRFSSRGEAEFANRILAALRFEFGGHEEKRA